MDSCSLSELILYFFHLPSLSVTAAFLRSLTHGSHTTPQGTCMWSYLNPRGSPHDSSWLTPSPYWSSISLPSWESKTVQPSWKIIRKFLKKLKIKLPYDPAIPHLGILSKERKTGSRTDIWIHMFRAASITGAKGWKQAKYPSTHKWINKMWYTQNRVLFSLKKWNSGTHYSINEPWKHAKWNTLDAKEQILFDSTSMRVLKQSMLYRWEQNAGFQVLGGEEESFHLMGVLAWNGGKLLKTVVIIAQQCEYLD